MKAEVPYLARLARQATGQAMLWPPRQLFAGDIDMPVRLPDRGRSPRGDAVDAATSHPGSLARAATGDEWIASEAIAPTHDADIASERWVGLEPGSAAFAGPTPPPEAAVTPATSAARALPPGAAVTPATSAAPALPPGAAVTPATSAAPALPPGAAVTPATSAAPALPPGAAVTPATSAAPALPPGAAVTPATSARQEPAAVTLALPGSPDMHWPPQVAPRRRTAPHSGPPAAGPPDSARARPVAPPKEPPASNSSRPAGGIGRARPPGAEARPLRGTPVDLPEAIELAPVADEATQRAVSASPVPPATPPTGPATAATAASRQGQRTDDAGAEGAAAPDRPWEPAQVRDLMPPPPSRTRPVTIPDGEAAEPYHERRAPGRPLVSIGTIEVTVVPPAPPSPAAREAQPPPPATRGWSRPPSVLASSGGRDRLRDGLRRWYGTAQS